MATRGLAAADYYASSPRPKWSAAKAALDGLNGFVKQMPEGGAVQALTIASGTLTPAVDAARFVTVDTEGAAASDDLANIAVTECPEGSFIFLRAANAARTVILKHAAGGSGQLSLSGAADLSLDTTTRVVLLRLESTTWVEVARFDMQPREEILEKTGAYTLDKNCDHGRTVSNKGAGGSIAVTLPAAVAGLRFRFVVVAAQTIEVTAGAGDVIQVAGSTSSSGGTASNGTAGSVLELLAIDADTWVAIATVGTWTTA